MVETIGRFVKSSKEAFTTKEGNKMRELTREELKEVARISAEQPWVNKTINQMLFDGVDWNTVVWQVAVAFKIVEE